MVAQRQEAKSYELRAVTSLTRLLRKEGRCEETEDRLATVYGWFTEGFDTVDLREAAALGERSGDAPETEREAASDDCSKIR
jgi:predicted ATPase